MTVTNEPRALRAGRHTLPLGERTLVMGIINVTPDSFSGDGLAADNRPIGEVVAAALDQGRAMVEAGAEILDVGGESTRPPAVYGAHPPVDAETEAALAVPVVAALAAELGDRVPISIDTWKGEVARRALAEGASIVNDVWAAERDRGTAEAAAEAGVPLVLVHNRERAEYPGGLLPDVLGGLRRAIEAAVGAGVDRSQIVVDPGIGFGKTTPMNLELLRRLSELRELEAPILVGTSRKRFIGDLLGGAPPSERVEGTVASVAIAIANGADIVRVHDVEAVARAVRVADGIVRGIRGGGGALDEGRAE